MRNLLFSFFLLAVAAVPFRSFAATVEDARATIDGIGSQALATISDKSLGKEQKEEKLQTLFSNAVDVPWVGRFVMGRYWKETTPEQQQKYLAEYDRFITANYAGRFADYTGGSYKILKTLDDGDGEFTVSMEIKSPDARQLVVVDYRLHDASGTLKIFDVVVEGVSLLTTQRAEFAQVLGNGGVDSLIGKMANHTLKQTEVEKKS